MAQRPVHSNRRGSRLHRERRRLSYGHDKPRSGGEPDRRLERAIDPFDSRRSGIKSTRSPPRQSPLLEALPESAQQLFVLRYGAEDPDHRHRRLLRARRERPRACTAEQRNELAALHSITSSAVESSVGGTVRLSALAVLRLITSSNLVGCCTGRSAGFSPLRMRST